ncbi:MAG: hypothetical protein R3C49_01915 [Planctomycetaceae bacterium]
MVLKTSLISSVFVAAILLTFPTAFSRSPSTMEERASDRKKAELLFSQNNFAEAETLYRQLAVDADNTDAALAKDFYSTWLCLQRLGRIQEFDATMEESLKAHPNSWALKHRIAGMVANGEVDSQGFMIAGEFERGGHRGGGKWASSAVRDRVRALQLMKQAIAQAEEDAGATAGEKGELYFTLAKLLGSQRYGQAWRLQQLTDLKTLPDYEENGEGYGFRGRYWRGSEDKGAPVDDQGNPVLYKVPESWEKAASDGERWRWALAKAAKADEKRISEADLQWAEFLIGQFGVEGQAVPLIGREQEETAELVKVHELADSETYARLATGERRLTLPEEFNHLSVLNRVISRGDAQKREALEQLHGCRMNRHQYPQAAELLKELKKLARNDEERKQIQSQIDQIEQPLGQFQNVNVQPAGKEPTFELRYRNAKEISFEARAIDIEAFLSDTKEYLQSRPEQLDHQKLQIENVGIGVMTAGAKKYVPEVSATWKVGLKPPEQHFDAIETISVPVRSAGAYLVTGKVQGGNELQMVIWVADTAITRKRIEEGVLNIVSDAVTGAPVAGAEMEFFGWRQERQGNTPKYMIRTNRFADRTDDDGLCIPDPRQLAVGNNWLTIARTKDGRLAYDGFNGVWNPQKLQPLNYSPVKVFRSLIDRFIVPETR